MLHRTLFLVGLIASSFTLSSDLVNAEESGKTGLLSISRVNLSALSFNPTQKEQIKLTYQLSHDADVTVQIFDSDFELIRTVLDKVHQKVGSHSETWDGRDLDGNLVPNESYFFTIEAEGPQGRAIYDPLTFSGGQGLDVAAAKYDRSSGILTYTLPKPSRVLIRVGTAQGGPLLRTLVDWEPRSGGQIIELWNGKDADNVMEVWNLPKFKMLVTAFTLPETSVITIGNSQYDYRQYKLALSQQRRKKEERPWMNGEPARRSSHFALPRIWDYSPRVLLTFPELDKDLSSPGITPVHDKVLVRVDAIGPNRDFIRDQQFEFIFYVDGIFFAEGERAYMPYTFPWELLQLPAGEHVLTVNLLTSKGQVGVTSRKVKVTR